MLPAFVLAALPDVEYFLPDAAPLHFISQMPPSQEGLHLSTSFKLLFLSWPQQSPNFFYSLPSPLPQCLSSYPLTGTLFLPPLEHKIHENSMSFFSLLFPQYLGNE